MHHFLDWRVVHAMHRDPICIRPDATLADAQRIFAAHDFNALPVTDESGVLVGVLSKLDVLRAYRFEPDQLLPPLQTVQKTPVEELIRGGTIDAATPMQPLTRVVDALLRTGHKSLPVVDRQRRVVGIIAREDVLGALNQALVGIAPPKISEEDAIES